MDNTAPNTPDTLRSSVSRSSGTAVGPGLTPPRRRAKLLRRILFVVLGLIILIAISVQLYRYYAPWESTDDAQIDGYIYPVNSRIPGYVIRVTVDDNQYVEAGTVLVQLDPKDYEVAVANAKAVLANDEASARLEQIQAQLRYNETAPQQISAQRSRAQAAVAETQRAAANLQQVQLNLQYTTIVAPVSGIVGQRSVQPGQNVSPGQQLMTIVPLDSPNIWVTANFKETQLTYMRPGQPVKISVDAYGRVYDGNVLNLAGASGARYSLLPPENATGNYVKVVQRLPVKIVLEKGQDPENLLGPGFSVVPSVRVKAD